MMPRIPGQGPEGSRITLGEPEHLIAEPRRAGQLEPESADRGEQALQLAEYWRADRTGRHEREEHREMRWDAEGRIGIKARDHQARAGALRNRPRSARSLAEQRGMGADSG
jgi:hypothetical protein